MNRPWRERKRRSGTGDVPKCPEMSHARHHGRGTRRGGDAPDAQRLRTGFSGADAIIIGSGPNGLAAGIVLARAGLSVQVLEAADTIGGSCRSAELTLPGFTHDLCATVHTLARVSPFLKTLPLAEHGLELIDPPAPFAHPFDDGTAAVAERSIDVTAATLGRDGVAYRKLMTPLVEMWDELAEDIFAPPHLPRRPLGLLKFGLHGIQSVRGLIDRWFDERLARGLFAGVAAHAVLPFDFTASAAIGLVLAASAHAAGWPVARGGSQRVIEALASIFRSLGGRIETANPIENIDDLPPRRLVLCDITPRQFLRIAGHRLPRGYARRLGRYRYGPGAFKLDWALDGPIPWTAAACRRAGTVHLGGTAEEIAASEHIYEVV